MKKILMIVLIIISIPIFMLGIATQKPNIALIAILMLFIGILVYAISLKEKALLLSFFLITFFTFLLGQYSIEMFSGLMWKERFNIEIINHILLCLYLSLFCIFVGFLFSNLFSKNKNSKENSQTIFLKVDDNIVRIIRILFYITISFAFICTMESVIFVRSNSYFALYIDFVKNLPYLFYKFAQLNSFLYYALLSTMPSKKEIKTPTVLFLLNALLTILAGARGVMVVSIMIVSMYFIYREICSRKMDKTKYKWIKLWYIYIAIIVLPLFIAFLSAYNNIRNGASITDFNLFTQIYSFFKDQGGSVNVIGYVKQYQDSLPSTNISYFFGPIIALFRNGFIGSIFSGGSIRLSGLVDNALYGNNLGATITYLVIPQLYLQGAGLGTQYIAEAYVDFGYAGVILFNLFIGFIIHKFNFNQTNKWYINALIFCVYTDILMMPRSFSLTWVAPLISVLYWGTIFLIIYLSKSKRKGR